MMGATAGLSSSARYNRRQDTAGQASSGTLRFDKATVNYLTMRAGAPLQEHRV